MYESREVSTQFSWVSNNFYITIESVDISPYVGRLFPLLSSNLMISVILGAMNNLSLSLFDNSFMYWKRIIVGDTVYPESMILC